MPKGGGAFRHPHANVCMGWPRLVYFSAVTVRPGFTQGLVANTSTEKGILRTMKHIKPVSKAADMSATDIITLIVSLLSALAPIISAVTQNKPAPEAEA